MEEETKEQVLENTTPTVENVAVEEAEKKDNQESIQAKNFRQLRESAEQLKRERDEAINLLHQTQQQKSASDDEDFKLNPDDLVEGKHLSKFQKKIKNLEDQVKSYESRSSELAIESRIKSDYPDFDRIVNQENINTLREQYPELAHTINSSGDLYSKAVSAYTLIKKLGLLPDPQLKKEQDLTQQNKLKPRSLASISPQHGESPLSHANAFENGLTEELKAQLRKEMFDARKRM